ncbi:MAG: hypothetical protein JNK65_06515 [Deltaproteobacteria bacterium]|nr:hypothetical protein [Deltaproteobacteria bacterium]
MLRKFLLSNPFFGILLLLLLSSCFFGGVKNSGRVKSYQPGLVKTEKGFYKVGPLPESWQRTQIQSYKTISFYNPQYKSTLMTDAFCDQSYDDASLKTLTTHLYFDLQDKKIQSQKQLMLNERAAMRSIAQGKVDGVPVVLDTLVIKKDWCLFDFALVADPAHYVEASKDFEDFYKGFEFEGALK